MSSTVHLSQPTPHITILEIDNPPANSLSKKMKAQFVEILDKLEANPPRVLVLTGRGNTFCVGDDLKEAIENIEAKGQGQVIKNLQKFGSIMDRVEALPCPTIGAINGWCIGGGLELALCCDIRLAVDTAQFICAGVNVGLTASGYRLPRIIGIGPAKKMLFTGTALPVEKALQYGLVTDIYPPDELINAATELAKTIASKAPLAVQATKRIANIAYQTDLQTAKTIQEKELLQLANTQDYVNALKAFSKKEKPIFIGK